MIESSHFEKTRGLLCGLGLLAIAVPSTFGEGLSLRVTDTGVPGVDEFFGANFLPDFKGGFYSGMTASTYYDSNLFLDTFNEKAEVYFQLEPWLAYRSDPDGGATCSMELLYAPIARVFWDEPHLDTWDHAGSASFRYRGGKTDILSYISYAEVSGPDRLAGGYVSGTVFSYGMRGSYQIAPKTMLVGAWRYAESDYDTPGRAGTDYFTADIGFDWTSGRRIGLGAAIQYSNQQSLTIGERESWALVGNMSYQVTDRIDLEASLGIEFAENSRIGGGSDVGPLGKMKLTYRLSERWRWNALIRYRQVPSPGNINYLVNDLLLSTSLTRYLHVGEIEGGVAYSNSQYESVGIGAPLASDKEQNLYLFLGYRRPIFSERLDFSTMISYTSNTGLRDWDQLQLSVGLTAEF
ncbi:hypothetical protein [Haloferula sp.]|uniref:hypothetical protein n=1 Tax=Haloferula sp. TaxID=2497595 RepID=UPI00329E7EAC